MTSADYTNTSGNWRVTFEEDGYIDRLNLEDYH